MFSKKKNQWFFFKTPVLIKEHRPMVKYGIYSKMHINNINYVTLSLPGVVSMFLKISLRQSEKFLLYHKER